MSYTQNTYHLELIHRLSTLKESNLNAIQMPPQPAKLPHHFYESIKGEDFQTKFPCTDSVFTLLKDKETRKMLPDWTLFQQH